MKYNWENGSIPPARVFDANGLEWRDVYNCDTQTGELEIQSSIDYDKGEIIREKVKTAAPLTVKFYA